jgi:DNA repair exonuclease SbcCD nuclease subunit
MKVGLFGDIHIYKHLSKAIFEDVAIQFIYDYTKFLKKEGITTSWFLGDFFHIKSKLFVPTYIRAIEALEAMKNDGIDSVFLIGNHDMPFLDSTDFSIMHSFKQFGEVIPDYNWKDIDNVRVHFLSYTHQLPEFEMSKTKKNVLFTHLDVKGFSMDGQISEHGFEANQFKQFELVISGHYHKHQFMGNIIYCGSPYQTRYSERFDDKGFMIFDTLDCSWEFKKYEAAPVFQEVSITDVEDSDVRGKFIRIKTTKDATDLPKLKDKLMAQGAYSVDFIYEASETKTKNLDTVEDLNMGDLGTLANQYFDAMLDQKLFDDPIMGMLDSAELVKQDFMDIFKEINEAVLTNWTAKDEEVAQS